MGIRSLKLRHMVILMDTLKKQRGGSGFTLIELLAVLVIMAMMMSVAVVAFFQITHAAGMRASVVNMQSSLNLARQNAITYRVRTLFTYGNMESSNELAVGYYVITTNGAMIGWTNRLNIGVVFTNPQSGSLQFTLDGSCAGLAVETNIMLMERDKGAKALSNMITVYPLTGRIKVKY